MAWMPNRTSNEMIAAFTATLAAIQATVAKLDGKVDRLAEDRVTRTDLTDLRQAMESGFSNADQKYVAQAVADQRFGEVKAKLLEHGDAIKALQQQPALTDKERFARWTTIAALIIAAIGVIVTLYGMSHH